MISTSDIGYKEQIPFERAGSREIPLCLEVKENDSLPRCLECSPHSRAGPDTQLPYTEDTAKPGLGKLAPPLRHSSGYKSTGLEPPRRKES